MRWSPAVLLLFLVAAGAAAAPPTDPSAPDPGGTPAPDFDPLAGIDPNGRIPAVERPADLEHPERWRYIPEGRLKPGNVFQRLFVSTVIAPFLFRDGDVGLGGGVGLIDIDFRQKRRREFAGLFASYSQEGQQSYSLVWRRWLHHRELPQGGVLQEERSFVRAFAGYSKTLTRRFYGFGPGTDENDETSYTDDAIVGELGFERALPDPGDDLVVELGLRGEFHELSRGHVDGKPSTDTVFPSLFDEADDDWLGWVIAGARWDTRDSQTNPYRGWHVGARAAGAVLQSGGRIGAVYTLDGSKIFPVPGIFHDGGDPDEENPPTDTLALGLRAELSSGSLPFFAKPSLGGSWVHRGFIDGRFRDSASWLARAEHRFWVLPRGIPIPFTDWIRIERVGLATFYEAGAVAEDGLHLHEARVRHTAGIGLRVTLERHAPFRVDLGFSEDGLNIAARFGLAF